MKAGLGHKQHLYRVKLHLSDKTTRYVMSNGKIYHMSLVLAEEFTKMVGDYGYLEEYNLEGMPNIQFADLDTFRRRGVPEAAIKMIVEVNIEEV